MAKYPTNTALREALSKLRADRKLTNPALGKLFSVSPTFISKYINDSLDHDPKDFEAVAADTIRAIENRLDLASTLFETSVSRAMAGRIDIARRTGHSCLFGSPAGEGKTSGGLLYQLSNPSTIYFKLSGTDRDAGAINSHLWAALRRADWSDNVKRWSVMTDAVRGSQRAIICDNAHRLDTSGRNALFDFSEDTGCPVIFLANPEILELIKRNDQQHSRIGVYRDLRLTDAELPNVSRRLAAQLSDDETAEEISDLVGFVASKPGRMRAVKMHVILMQELRTKDGKLDARTAFRTAHRNLVSDYALPSD
jgi:DNA transposition AAA+ family ATPase